MGKVFISYSHKDKKWKDRLVSHLNFLEVEGLLEVWEDRKIRVGDDWFAEIEKAILSADVAVLMISVDFLNSKFIRGEEVPRLLKRQSEEGLRIFPLIVRPCLWDEIDWLSSIQGHPEGGRHLSDGNDNEIEHDLVKFVKEILAFFPSLESVKSVSDKDELFPDGSETFVRTRTSPNANPLKILLACARPLASRFLRISVEYEKASEECQKKVEKYFADMKMNRVDMERGKEKQVFYFSLPVPPIGHITGGLRKLEGVRDIAWGQVLKSHETNKIDDELKVIRNGLGGLDKAVQVDLLSHVTFDELHDRLDRSTGYDILHLVAHGGSDGTILLEEGNGLARHISGADLAEAVGTRVALFINGTCFGGEVVSSLLGAGDGNRPGTVIFAHGDYPIQARAIQLFSETFYKKLVDGENAEFAFLKGVGRVKRDGTVGETAYPDGFDDHQGPTPFKRFQIDKLRETVFPAPGTGKLAVRNIGPSGSPHLKIVRAIDVAWGIYGRKVETVTLMEKLLPPKRGIVENKKRLINLCGEGGIGKTTLAQEVCHHLSDYPLFPGGIFELDCEPVTDTPILAVALLSGMGFADAESVKKPVSLLPEYIRELSKKSGALLLFLDNIDGIYSDPTANLLKMILTQVPGIRIITTCRTRLELGPISENHLVAPLDAKNASALFMGLLKDNDYICEQILSIAGRDNKLLKSFLETLGGHPLSIFLAAHRISKGHDPIKKQLAEAYKNTLALLNAPEIRGLPERQKSLRVSLDQSFEQLSENAKNIFCKAGFFPGGLYRNVATLDKLLGQGWREAMEEILGIGLCRFQKETQRYWFLNPVREYSKDRLSETGNTEFYNNASNYWAEFVSWYDYLLNPSQNPERMKKLDLPEEPDVIRQKLEELHDKAFSALRAEEQNIFHAFRWAIKNDFQAGESIASGIRVDCLGIIPPKCRVVLPVHHALQTKKGPGFSRTLLP